MAAQIWRPLLVAALVASSLAGCQNVPGGLKGANPAPVVTEHRLTAAASKVYKDALGRVVVVTPEGQTRVYEDHLGRTVFDSPQGTLRIYKDHLDPYVFEHGRGSIKAYTDALGRFTIEGPKGATRIYKDFMGRFVVDGPDEPFAGVPYLTGPVLGLLKGSGHLLELLTAILATLVSVVLG